MFDDWRRDAVRKVDPPRAVVVRLSQVWPSDRLGWGRDTPLWVRAAGMEVRTEVPGLLHTWVLSSVGRWWPWVTFTVRSSNGELEFEVDQLVPAEAVRPVE
ncbi:hypothetical protein BAY59_38595 (plasmid) [Prauserella coralliicola]|nr:hypothetical protein BAY59_38595 [Prauserella coralliicola]